LSFVSLNASSLDASTGKLAYAMENNEIFTANLQGTGAQVPHNLLYVFVSPCLFLDSLCLYMSLYFLFIFLLHKMARFSLVPRLTLRI